MASDRPIFRESGWELASGKVSHKRDISGGDSGESSIERAARRAKSAVRDIARSNAFTHFVTLTLDRQEIDRYDMAAITKKLNTWLDNHVRRDGLFYVLIPERHKDGAIHFHGLFNGALAAVPSGTWTAAGWNSPRRPRSAAERREWVDDPEMYHEVFNLPAWTLGFTTAIPLYGDYDKAVEYVCKYCGKQGDKPGGRWYYSGGALQRPEITYPEIDYNSVTELPGAYTFRVDAARAAFVIARGKEG